MKKTRRRKDLFLVITWVASIAAVATLLWILESIITPAIPAIQKTGFILHQYGLGCEPGPIWCCAVSRGDSNQLHHCPAFCVTPGGIYRALFKRELPPGADPPNDSVRCRTVGSDTQRCLRALGYCGCDSDRTAVWRIAFGQPGFH